MSSRAPDMPATEPHADGAGVLAFADALLARNQSEPGQGTTEIQQYVLFALHERDFCVPILQCREIVRVSSITRMPEAPEHVRGVVNLRGRILPVVDTRRCLGIEVAPPTSRSRLLLVEIAGRLLALLVDRVVGILKLPAGEIQAPPKTWSIPGCAGMARVGESAIAVLDIEHMLQLLHANPTATDSTARSDEA
jgi:purine-binding chemotaxis protein CheW